MSLVTLTTHQPIHYMEIKTMKMQPVKAAIVECGVISDAYLNTIGYAIDAVRLEGDPSIVPGRHLHLVGKPPGFPEVSLLGGAGEP